MAATQGWTESSAVTARELALRFDGLGLAAIIYTDIMKDGMSTGPNIEATRELAEAVNTPVIISGGVANLEDIERCLPLASLGVAGIITGRAIYTGALDLAEAIRTAKKSRA
jgi:phosphoribosylformimino-5-aminoimidazole carboxamide ribotide isomerase